jgi:hypothetical protein
MENQQIFNMVVGVAAFFGGWVLNNITRSLERLDKDVRSMPMNYITKADYHRDVDEIKSICKQIFDKLDNKADKP